MEYYSTPKVNKLSTHENTRGNLMHIIQWKKANMISVWFQLYDILKKEKSGRQYKDQE